MTDNYHRTVKIADSFLQHILRAHVEMIRRFIENQEIHRFQQQLNHGKTGTLSAGKHFHLLVRSLATKHECSQYITYLQPDIPYRHTVDGIEYRKIFIQQLRLILSKIANLHVVSQSKFSGIIRNLVHDTLYKCRLTLTVLTYKSHLLTTVYGEIYIVEYDMVAIRLGYIFTNNRIVTATAAANELQPQRRVVFLVHFNALYLLQLLDTALHLHGFGSFVAEALDELFRILYLFLLVFISAELLFTAFLAKRHKLIVFHFIIINTSAGYFNSTGSDIIQESTVVADKYHCIGTGGEKVLQPLDALYVEVVRRFIEQQYVRTAQQQLGKFDTHTPAAGELTRRAVEVFSAKAQPLKSTLYLGTIISAAHHQKAFVLVGKAVYQLLIILAVIIGTFGKLLVHTFDVGLHLKDMLKGKFSLLHHSTFIAENHYLRQVTDSTFAGDGNNTGSGLLNTCQYFEHGGLTRPILADKGYTVFLINNVRNVFKQRSSIKFHLQSFYRYHSVNELIVQDCKGNDIIFYSHAIMHSKHTTAFI